MILTVSQIRAARALTRLGLRELARETDLSTTALSDIETGKTSNPRRATLDALQSALEAHGVEFGANGWIRHESDRAQTSTSLDPLPAPERAQLLALLREATRILGGEDPPLSTLAAGPSGPSD